MGPAAGEFICGHIQLEDPAPFGVGVEALGPVFSAREHERDLPLWVTILDLELFPSELALSQFMAAANAWSTVRHPGLLPLAVVDRERDYCVIGHERWPDTRSLADLLMLGPGVPEPEHVDGCAGALARTLAFLHSRGLVHGALSPASCFVWERTYLLWQHGLAPLCDRKTLARRAREGSDWLRPDLLAAQGPTPDLDVLAWGVTVARMGCLGEPDEAVNAVIDRHKDLRMGQGVQEVVRAALQPDRQARPANGQVLLAMLEAQRRDPGSSSATRRDFVVSASADGFERSLDSPHAATSSELLRMEDLEELRPEESVPPPLAPDRTTRTATPKQAVRGPTQRVPPRDPAPEEPDLLGLAAASVSLAKPAASTVSARLERSGVDSYRTSDPRSSRSSMLRPPRVPGPHGPSPVAMVVGLGLLAIGIPALAFLHTIGVRGGLAAVFHPIQGSLPAEPAPAVSLPPEEVHQGPAPAAVEARNPNREAEPEPSGIVDRPCPAAMAPVDGICMDLGEWPGLRRKPQVGLTFQEAASTCDTAGKRLCTRDEWARACAGASGRDYPYGTQYEPGMCNTASVAGFPAELAVSGSHPQCRSEAGIYDLVGNAGEWVSNGVAVGGDRMTEGERATCAAEGRPPVGYAGPDLGFRCCWDPSPQAGPPL